MSGIAGFWGRPDPSLLERQATLLSHRGTLRDSVEREWGSVVVIHPKLGDDQIHVGDDLILAVSGQRFDDIEMPAIVDIWRTRGPEFVAKLLRGSFILVALEPERLTIVRDGAGVRTVYHGEHNGRVFFGSEPKAVHGIPGHPRRLRMASVPFYLTFSFIPGEQTMLEDVQEVPAGHLATIDENGHRYHRHFEFENAEGTADDLDEDAWVDRWKELFATAIEQRLTKCSTPAVFLSGGIDSSVVAAELAAQRDERVNTFAIHFGPEYPHELEFAQAVADQVGARHEEVEIRPEAFLPALRRIIWHLDDPIGDPITVPNYLLAEHVSQRGFDQVFNGEGGDPCFGGPKNLSIMLHHWYGGVPRGDSFRERAYLASYRRAYRELEYLLLPGVVDADEMNANLEGTLRPYFQAERPRLMLHKLLAINIRLKGAHLILPKVDRMLAAHGLVPMSPFFDEAVVESAFAMPPRLKVADGIEKVVLKRAYEHQLPESVLLRPKSGMRVPVHFWFRGEMKRYAESILGSPEFADLGIFDPARVRQLLDYEIAEGAGRYGLRLWMLLTFELWRRIVVEGEAV